MKNLKWKQLPLLLPAILYGVFYLIWFSYVERTVTHQFTLIHMQLDNYIPFVEAFVIPYFLWFPYVAITVVLFCLLDKKEYAKICLFLFSGMTVFLIISTLFPNGQNLRPHTFARDNLFTNLIAGLYKTDTPTNIVPSIHVYNSIGVHIAIAKSEFFQKKKGIRIASFFLCTSIILSTMLIKQHSVFDVITAFIMAGLLYPLIYVLDLSALRRTKKETVAFTIKKS